jgi:PDZ domain-containing protein
MTSSQDAATAAALSALHIPFRTEVAIPIMAVTKGGAADGKLKAGDLLVAVDGRTAQTSDGYVRLIRAVTPGTALPLTVLRGGKRTTVTVTTAADPQNARQSRINVSVGPAQVKGIFPFKVRIRLSDTIGGPSAGMMFALSIYDLLTPGSLTGGKMIAGSGTIDPTGVVGPIGGIGQKIVGAQRDGAHLFLVAQENCAEAARAHYDKSKIRLVKVHTLAEAIEDVEAWRDDPKADLPGCGR